MNKKILIFFIIVFLTFSLLGCKSTGKSRNDTTPQVLKTPTGDDINKMELTIVAPNARGLNENENYLPTLVQGEFVSNFTGYSVISVRDRERLDDQYAELLSGYYDDSADESLGRLIPTSHLMGGNITKTATGYALQMFITRKSDKMTIASYSGTFTFVELDNLTGVRRASLALFERLGVPVTSQTRNELSKAATDNHVNAQTTLARGITAERQGTVEALNYYNQAAIYDPTLLEAANRLSRLNTNVSSGNLGEAIRNDIADRRNWVALLTETEQYFDSFHRSQSMPYTLFYLNDIKRGTTNYQNETVTLSTETYLYSSGVWSLSIERTLQAIYDGLRATGKASTWELSNWPQRGVTNLNAFAEKRDNFSVVFELVNSQNKVIGRQTLQAGGSWSLNWSGRPSVNLSSADRRTINFQNVDVKEITDNLTIRIATVNGIDGETAARSGVLQIRPITKAEVDRNDRFRYSKGEIQGFANYTTNAGRTDIPSVIWGDPVLSIRQEAFKNTGVTILTLPNSITVINEKLLSNTGLTGVIIPNSVTVIGNNAFSNNSLTNVSIPNSVVSIGDEAFSNNPINNLNIGNNVTSIGARAFQNNNLTSVTLPESVTVIGEAAFQKHSTSEVPGVIKNINIGANVILPSNTFRISWRYYNEGNLYEGERNGTFNQFYTTNNKKAGTYNLISSANFIASDNSIWFYGDNETAKKKNTINKTIFWASSITAMAAFFGVLYLLRDKPVEGPVY
ncbi:MAG: leucine-rich repeat domain-containing protein [Treponema sp.]|nr:leucine-rich repeat domain-containing protein [Treponema sp.]